MERDFWFSIARSFDKLEKPEDVGKRAAERALRRLGCAKGTDAEGSHYLRTACRAIAAGQHIRRSER